MGEADFHEEDAQALPLDDNSFDAAVCGYGLIHVPKPDRVLSEMYRVLRPGGRLATSVWQPLAPGNGFGLLFDAIKAHADLEVPLPHGPDFFQFSDHVRMAAAPRSINLKDVAVQDVDQLWELDNPLGALEAVLEGGVRTRGLVLAQTEAVQKAIADSVRTAMAKFASANGRYAVPMPAIVGAGVK